MKKNIFAKAFVLLFFCLFFGLGAGISYANNISVTNLTLGTQDTTAKTIEVQFDISWENSWRDAVAPSATANYDAAWVFIKYSTDGGSTWSHALLKGPGGTNPAGFSRGTQATLIDIVVPTDLVGAFIQRSGTATQSLLNCTVIKLLWDYNAAGLTDANALLAPIKVFAIEMVYVTSGSFSVGPVGAGTASFYTYNTTTTPYTISNENAINVGATANYLYYALSGYSGDQTGPVPAGFPKGYNAFYCMKYLISQGQYRDFLNTLTRTQQNNRIASQTSGYWTMTGLSQANRNSLRNTTATVETSSAILVGCDLNSDGVFNGLSDGEWIALNYANWMDVAAFTAWAGLRPMTEFEYEKAARGANTPVSNEYAWGTTDRTNATSITNSGQNSEVAGQTGNGLCVSNSAAGVPGPMRSGFSATSSTTRLTAGAGYYGTMDLSGNVWKSLVSIGKPTGRGFIGSNGTGVLSVNGNATNSDWPGYASGEVTGVTGFGLRGDAWNSGSSSTSLQVADRALGYYDVSSRLLNGGGVHCVRTYP